MIACFTAFYAVIAVTILFVSALYRIILICEGEFAPSADVRLSARLIILSPVWPIVAVPLVFTCVRGLVRDANFKKGI